MKPLPTLLLLCMFVAAAAGCQPRGPIVPEGFMPPPVEVRGPMPTYDEIIARYNAGVADLDRVWSATDVEIRWRDDEGDAHFEKGDGKFLFVRPSRVALTVEKLGKTYLWVGSDDQRFWMFDQQDRTAYVGRHQHVGKACAEPLPLPIHPSAMPYLLGLVPIEPSPSSAGWLGGAEPMAMRVRGHYLIEVPQLNLAMWLHPESYRPVRVDLTDPAGRSVVRAMLSDDQPVAQHNTARERWPLMPSHADLFVQGQEARMTLKLSRLSDGRQRGRIRDAAFDFETLIRAHKPETVIELDRGCD